jgi:phosphoribosylaminoimidazole-succinocarboxamide synthase
MHILQTNVDGFELKRGKVRDIYDLGDKLLLVATDRISAFDYVLPNCIPEKGKVLTGLSVFWSSLLKNCKYHLITTDQNKFPTEFQGEEFVGRTMLVKKFKVIPYECVVRGYLCGSAWQEYQATGGVCGILLPKGLKENQQFPIPLFTPATKAKTGHDENISFERLAVGVGLGLAQELRHQSIKLYIDAAQHAWQNGIIIADTKFEWGLANLGQGTTSGLYSSHELVLIDEILTPDSSRFWALDEYELDVPMPSFDKQYVRDWLINSGWDKSSPPPSLPDDVVSNLSKKYLEAYKLIVGRTLCL